MIVTQLTVERFRNLAGVTISPIPGVNVIAGENGQGKTNLLEAIWLCTGARSFRGAKEAELLPFGSRYARFSVRYTDAIRPLETCITLGEKKEVTQNGVPLSSLSELAGSFCAVVFSPTHLSLVKGGPAERRRALDVAIGQTKPRYYAVLQQYQKLLQQRNTLLKDIPLSASLLDTLDIWDDALAKAGALITKTRETFLERLLPVAAEFYAGISGGREEFSLCYQPSLDADGDRSADAMRHLLRIHRSEEIKTGMTSIGPHRDDVDFLLGGNAARLFGSQGQQRSIVLALKLAEAAVIEAVTGEVPVILLDDVMSELDDTRREYLLHRLEGRQIFVTACDARQVATAAKLFTVAAGSIVAESP